MNKIKKTAFVFAAILLFFLLTVFFDKALALFGFSSDESAPAAYPPGYRKEIKNREYEYLFTANSQGLRYPEIPLEKPEGEYRVAVAGDSFTQGMGVKDNEAFPALLEKYFSSPERKARFINLGLTGAGPFEEAKAFLNVGLKYQPDALLIAIYANDLFDTPDPKEKILELKGIKPRKSGWRGMFQKVYPRTWLVLRKRYGILLESLRKKDFLSMIMEEAARQGIPGEKIEAWEKNMPAEWAQAAHEDRMNPALLSLPLFHPDYWTMSLDMKTEESEKRWENMKEILGLMAGEAKKRGIKVASIYIPCNFQYDPKVFEEKNEEPFQRLGSRVRPEWLAGETEFEKHLKSFWEKEKVPFLNLTASMREAVRTRSRLYYKVDGHWTPEGHLAASEVMSRWLAAEKIFGF